MLQLKVKIYPLFLVLNGMAFGVQMRILSDIFRIKLILGECEIILPPPPANLTVRYD